MDDKRGRVITFYSYKGGTGRSMAVANVACLLARRPEVKKGVLAIDWDLEAPGLQYFLIRSDHPPNAKGVIEAISLLEQSLISSEEDVLDEDNLRIIVNTIPLSEFVLPTMLPNLKLMPAGRFDHTYPDRISSFDWRRLFERSPQALRVLAERLATEFDFVLVDSRTGHNDISGICTSLLPDQLVIAFTPNKQSLVGGVEAARRAAAYRKRSEDLRPLLIIPLPSRIELAEPELVEDWRYGNSDDQEEGYQARFEQLFRELYDLESCDLKTYFDEVQIQHVPRYAYGERVAVLIERGTRLSLSRSYAAFAEVLARSEPPWNMPPSVEAGAALVADLLPEWDEPWISYQRTVALSGLGALGFEGSMEICLSLKRSNHKRRPKSSDGPHEGTAQLFDQMRLLWAAGESQVHAFGWPIGVVLDNNEEGRPKSMRDGIVAKIASKHIMLGPSYDYWTLRCDGDFYQLSSMIEESFDDAPDKDGTVVKRLNFDTRMVRVAEVLLYARRLYRNLGFGDRRLVSVKIRHSGLRGRVLSSSNPMRPVIERRTNESAVETSLIVALDSIEENLAHLVQQLLSPLFLVFDFASFREEIYLQIVNGFLTDVRQKG